MLNIFLIRSFALTVEFDSVFHWTESYLGIFFQSVAFIGTSMMDRFDLLIGLTWCFMVEWNRLWYSIVISCLIAFLFLKSPFSSRASARLDRCWRLSWCESAIVSLNFYRAKSFLNALNVDRKDILNNAGSSLVLMLSLVECDILISIWETTNL